jgi:hypothetical protein
MGMEIFLGETLFQLVAKYTANLCHQRIKARDLSIDQRLHAECELPRPPANLDAREDCGVFVFYLTFQLVILFN